MEYLFLVLVLLGLIYHYDYRDHLTGRKVWYFGIMIYMILLAGLRYRLGNDTVAYSMSYNDYPDIFNYWDYDFTTEKFGRGYLLVNAIARTISDNFVAMQMILAIFVNTVIFRFFYKNTNKIFTAAFLYFLFSFFGLNMEVLREACAVSMFLIGWEFFWRHKWVKYYICIVIGILFHPSVMFTLILPLFTMKFFHKFFTVSWLSFGIAVGLFFVGFILTSKFFDIIRLIGIATLDSYADSYEYSSFAEGKNFNFVGSAVFMLRNLLYPFAIGWLIAKKKIINKKLEDETYARSLMVMFIMYIYISSLSISLVILYRFNSYLSLFFILTFSEALFHKLKFFRKVYCLSYSLWFVLIFPMLFLQVRGLFEPVGRANEPFIIRVYPYSNVINPELNDRREALYLFNAK